MAQFKVPGLDEDVIYSYRQTSKGGMAGNPIRTDFSKADFATDDAKEDLTIQLYSEYGYDPNDQYYMGTEDGRKYVSGQIE
jgi:hypothetical protein